MTHREMLLYLGGLLMVVAGTAVALLVSEWRAARRELTTDWVDGD